MKYLVWTSVCRLGALGFVLGACRQSSSSSAAPVTPVLPDLGLAAERFEGNGALLVLGVQESAQGGLDRNGDGDALDEVAYALNLASAAPSGANLGLALSRTFPFPLEVCQSTAALAVSESGQGDLDLNQDGDAEDDVLVVYVQGSRGPVTIDTRLALAPLRPLAGGVAFAVSEAAQGHTDLNGDGDAVDAIPRVLGPDGEVRGPAMAVRTLLGVSGGLLLFTTDEAERGSDLNGDGDALDPDVLQFYDFQSDALLNTGLDAVHALYRSDARLDPLPRDWLVLLDERGRGLDLDGDGSADDHVAHLYARSGSLEDLAVACVPRPPLLEPVSGATCVFAREDGLVDRNGDGDRDDVTPVRIQGSRTVDVPFALDPDHPGLVWSRGELVFAVSEAAQGADLDGDGDLQDLVVHVGGSAIRNLGLDSRGLSLASGSQVLIARAELDSRTDWNRDGDLDDTVAFVLDTQADTVSNTAVAGAVLGTSSARLLLAVSEGDDGRDWNRDGDRDDLVYVHHDLALGRNTGLDLEGASGGAGRILDTGHSLVSVVLVDEQAAARDLNRDGDQGDRVPQAVE